MCENARKERQGTRIEGTGWLSGPHRPRQAVPLMLPAPPSQSLIRCKVKGLLDPLSQSVSQVRGGLHKALLGPRGHTL